MKRKALAATALLLLFACNQEPTGCNKTVFALSSAASIPPCIVPPSSAIVYGSVRDSAGVAAAGLPVEIRAYLTSCDHHASATQRVVTDAGGRYRDTVSTIFGGFVAQCLAAIVNPDSVSGWPRMTVRLNATLAFRSAATGARDSLAFDLVIPVR